MNTPRDENRIATLTAALDTDGITQVSIVADASTHTVRVADNSSGTDQGVTNAGRDENRITGLMAVSSSDGTTPVPVYATSSGLLKTKSS